MPAYWAERINRAVEKTALALVETGQEARAAKDKLKHGQWLEMFNTKQVKLDLSLAQRLMKVASHPALANAANLPFLPPSPTALVALSKLPPEVVEAGIAKGCITPSMTIADAAKFVKGHQPEPASDKGVEDAQEQQPEEASVRKDFLAVLWDDSGAPPTCAPEKSYGAKTYPKIAFFRFHNPGDIGFGVGSKYGLTRTALFVVPVEQGVLVKDNQGRSICKAICRFLALSVRGDVPEPSAVPAQIIEEGYEGVVKMIESMFPDALKAVSTTRAEAPNGWELVPRESKDSNSPKPSGAAPGTTERTQTPVTVMLYHGIDYEEEFERENSEDWMSLETVHDRIRGSLDMLEDMALEGIAPLRLPVRLYPGDGVVCIPDPEIFIRVAEHVGYGFRIICRLNSHELLFDGQPCPVCSSFFAEKAMYLQFRWLMPCQFYAAIREDGWRWYKDAKFSGLRWLEFDDKLLLKLSGCDFLNGGIQLERTADWGWTLKAESRVRRWSESVQRPLRRGLPLLGIRLPTKQMLAEAVKVAEANWHHSPEPGRTAKVLRWLPKGAVVVPCHFASKKPRVYWRALWTALEFAEYGNERADKGNLAVRMGPADIRSFDWDTDEAFREFLRVNIWARTAQQSFGARGGNVWCRMKLSFSQEKCWLLERVKSEGKIEKAGEFRAGNCLTTISGAHPSGVLYRVKNPGCLPLVCSEDVRWPDGVRLHEQPVRRAGEYDDTPGEISLDLSKIEGLHDHSSDHGSLEGRCPVCASEGKDTACDNLKIWPSGAFHCIRECDHSEIFALIGRRRRGWRGNSKNETARGKAHGRFISRPLKYDITPSHNK